LRPWGAPAPLASAMTSHQELVPSGGACRASLVWGRLIRFFRVSPIFRC
jgi:hypothetical protein